MRLALVAFVLLACGSTGHAPSVDRTDTQDASAEDPDALPPAPDTPGCAMTIDGEPSVGSQGAARLTHYKGGPWLRLFCGEVAVDVPRPRGGDVQHGAATFSRYGAEYRGSCDVRLDKLAIRDRIEDEAPESIDSTSAGSTSTGAAELTESDADRITKD